MATGNSIWPSAMAPRSPAPREQASCIYRNDGVDPATSAPIFTLSWIAPFAEATMSVAWGDYDGDGRLDLAVGNGHIFGIDTPQNTAMQFEPRLNRIYRNAGLDPAS
ncbi:MAG: VCBS repeat-containing protein [Kouleothrix sp.]|nr:VCBS repeat-containing protein [Kouleothrix sp.]